MNTYRSLKSVPGSLILQLASVNRMNFLVACWLKHYKTEVAKQFYECYTGQLSNCYLAYRICCQIVKIALCCSVLKHDLASLTFRKENFGQENCSISLAIRQICQNFLPPKFCIVQLFLPAKYLCRRRQQLGLCQLCQHNFESNRHEKASSMLLACQATFPACDASFIILFPFKGHIVMIQLQLLQYHKTARLKLLTIANVASSIFS